MPSGFPSVGNGIYTANSAGWSTSITGDTVLSLLPTTIIDATTHKQVILVGTNGQGLRRSNDGGANFAPVTVILSDDSQSTNTTAEARTRSSPTRQTPTAFTPRSTIKVCLRAPTTAPTWVEIDQSIPQITSSPFLVLATSLNRDGDTNLYVATSVSVNANPSSQLTGALRAELDLLRLDASQMGFARATFDSK